MDWANQIKELVDERYPEVSRAHKRGMSLRTDGLCGIGRYAKFDYGNMIL